MPFIGTPERVGFRRGLRESMKLILEGRFGPEGLKLMPEIEKIHTEAQLRTILEAVARATELDEVRCLLLPENP